MIVLATALMLAAHCAVWPAVECTEGKTNLSFSFITSITGKLTSSGGIPVIDLALKEINNDSRLLLNYHLQYTTILDSKCKSTPALESFLQHFDGENEPTYVTSMCCGCSSATIPVAEISHHWNVPQISFASADPILNIRERFKSIFRTLPCYIYVPPTVATLFEEFNWKQMAIIRQDEPPFNSAANGIKTIFEEQGWKLEYNSVIDPSSGFKINFQKLLDWGDDHRIILINTFESYAYHILCEAYHKYGERLLNQEVVLILHGRYMTEWWESTAHQTLNSSCTRDEVMMALNNTLALTPETYSMMENVSAVSYSGITPENFLMKYKNLLMDERYSTYAPLHYFGNAYDAMWVVAYGLDLVDRWAENGTNISGCETDEYPGELVRLSKFNYTNKRMGCYMRRAFHEVDITGITGPIRFKPDGARPENVMRLSQHRVTQLKDGNYIVNRSFVARVINEDNYAFGAVQYVSNGSVVFTEGEDYSTIWPDGSPPYDGSPVDVLDSTHLAITIIYSIFGIVGLIFVVIALIFNTVFRNKRVVKLGSPNLNFLIIAGAILLYLALFFYATLVQDLTQQLEETIFCNFRFWLFSLGNTLCFAVILAKQWRIYYIFSNPTTKKKVIKDWMLMIVVAVIVAIEVVVMTIGTAVPKWRLTANITLVEKFRQRDGVNEMVYAFTCIANTSTEIWIGITFGYKALLQLAAIFMAFTTRKVKVKGLNDTKELYTIIYINTVIITALIVIEFALRSHRDVYIILYGLAIFTGATLFLGLTFIPKAVLLRTYPNGKSVFTERESLPATTHFNTIQNNTQDLLEMPTAQDIQARITQLQQQLAYLQKEEDTGNQRENKHNDP